jgi:hypothetical protein
MLKLSNVLAVDPRVLTQDQYNSILHWKDVWEEMWPEILAGPCRSSGLDWERHCPGDRVKAGHFPWSVQERWSDEASDRPKDLVLFGFEGYGQDAWNAFYMAEFLSDYLGVPNFAIRSMGDHDDLNHWLVFEDLYDRALLEVTPNPGSDLAQRLGCRCPVLDNGHGVGRGDGNFVVNMDCPVHSQLKDLSDWGMDK